MTALFNKNVIWKSIWHQFMRIRILSRVHFVITILLRKWCLEKHINSVHDNKSSNTPLRFAFLNLCLFLLKKFTWNSCCISKGLFLIQQHYSKNSELYDCVIYNTTTERRIVLFWSTVFVQYNSNFHFCFNWNCNLGNIGMVPFVG